MRSATAYIRSRHAQKSSCAPSRVSALATNARWNAWLCASTMPAGAASRGLALPQAPS
jgi:hypothetical protein